MKANNIDGAVAHGILKTINRFRENPFLYLSESDLHASLLKDIVDEGGTDLFNFKVKDTNLYLSKVHLDYQTGFELINSGADESDQEVSSDPSDHIKRKGVVDLVVLKESEFNRIVDDTMEHAIGARKEDAVLRLLSRMVPNDTDPDLHEKSEPEYPVGELIDYAIEVSFSQFRNPCMEVFEKIRADNFILSGSVENGTNAKAVNLIFGYYHWNNSNWVSDIEGDYYPGKKNLIRGGDAGDLNSYLVYDAALKLIPDRVLNIFIDVRIDANGLIENTVPLFYYHDSNRKLPYWVGGLIKGLCRC